MSADSAATAGSEGAIRIQVNGEPRAFGAGRTVHDLLDALSIRRVRVAVSVNREVVPRSRHEEHVLHEGDRVEILEAVGGG